MITSVMTYTADHNGYLPGPLHPAIHRSTQKITAGAADVNYKKTLMYYLRPYIGSTSTYKQQTEMGDELTTCPTAVAISPDSDFASGAFRVPFNYCLNSYGMLTCPMNDLASGVEWYHTDPLHYFGCWYLGDSWPASNPAYNNRRWKPKAIDQIKNASAEWAIADAWYRRIPAAAVRAGSVKPREFLGSFPSPDSGSPLPSQPYHNIPLSGATATRNAAIGAAGVLPRTQFKGFTNMAYLDGHAASEQGQWIYPGDGGTINVYWKSQGGRRTTYACP
jgi:prepilin-type processing-associated H-X9-DG protein